MQNIADVICARADRGLDYGVVLLPDGLLAAIPELATLVADLNALLAAQPAPAAGGPGVAASMAPLETPLNVVPSEQG